MSGQTRRQGGRQRRDEDPGPGSSAVVPAQSSGGGAVTRSQANEDAMRSIVGMVEQRRGQLEGLLGRGVDLDRWITVALQAVQTTPDLLQCDRLSILAGIRQAAQYGLEIGGGPLSDASLIPEQGKARLQIEYRGLRRLALRDGEIVKIDAEVVYVNDDFRIELGDEPRIHHVPFLDGDRGAFRGAYAYAKLRSGEIIPHWMPIADLDKRRNASRSYRAGSGPWIQWAAEMYRKTALAGLCRAKLKLDPVVREALGYAEDVDPRLAGAPVAPTGRQLQAGGSAASQLRQRLQAGMIEDAAAQNGAPAGAAGQGGQEAGADVQSGADAGAAGPGPSEGPMPADERAKLPPSSPADPATGEVIQDPAAAAKPVADERTVCGRVSIYGDGSTCTKEPGHELGADGKPSTGANRIHRSSFATWEDGQQA